MFELTFVKFLYIFLANFIQLFVARSRCIVGSEDDIAAELQGYRCQDINRQTD